MGPKSEGLLLLLLEVVCVLQEYFFPPLLIPGLISGGIGLATGVTTTIVELSVQHKNHMIKILKKLQSSGVAIVYNKTISNELMRQRGNDLFRSGDFSNAVKTYTEAIVHNPTDPKIYSNRAGCYTKLMLYDLAIKDCDKCIELDPNFGKAYRRKGMALELNGDKVSAKAAYEKALQIDPECTEAKEGYYRVTDDLKNKLNKWMWDEIHSY